MVVAYLIYENTFAVNNKKNKHTSALKVSNINPTTDV